jgi:tetratricopeptide (TPR) repeat protein
MNIETTLVQLETAQLVRRLDEAEPAYQFKHALVQETAYASLLKQTRREIHRVVAETLEQIYADRLDEYAAMLARHYAEAGDHLRAANYFLRVGDAASQVFAPVEARWHYAHALDHLARAPDSMDNYRLRVATTTQYAIVAFVSEPPEQVLLRLTAADTLAQQLTTAKSDRLLHANLRYWIGRYHNIMNRPLEGIHDYEQVLAEAQELEEQDLATISSGEIGLIRVRLGQYGGVDGLLQPAIAHWEKLANWQQWTYLLAHHAMSLTARGRVAEGFAEGERILSRASALNAPSAMAVSNLFLSFIYMLGGEPKTSLAASEDAIKFAQQTGELLLVNMSHGFRAWAASRLGNFATAHESCAIQDETARVLGGQFILPEQYAAIRAEVALNEGKTKEAIPLAQQAVAIAQPLGGIFGAGLAQRVWAQALAESGHDSQKEVDDHLATSLQLFEEGECVVEAARTHSAWGKFLREYGDKTIAREHFERAAVQFEASGLRQEWDEAQRMLADMQ